ncbi:tandem-95 repeat protein, partial [bacterium]
MFSQQDFARLFTDPEGSALSAVRISPLPDHGTLFLGSTRLQDSQEISISQLDSLIYLPDTDWHGSDSLGWFGTDGADYSAEPGLISLTILPANDNPQITDEITGPVVMDEDGAPHGFSLILHAGDVDLVDTLAWSIAEQPEFGTASTSAGGFEASVDYNPAADYSGSDSFKVQVEDGSGGKDTLVVEVLVRPANDPPRVSNSSKVTIEDISLHFKNDDFLENYSDEADGDRMIAIRINVLPSHGKLLLNGQAVAAIQDIPLEFLADLVYAPNKDFTGTDTFAWAGYDGNGYSIIPATISIITSNVSDAPQITGGEQVVVSMDEDGTPQPFHLTLEALDPDPGETLTWSFISKPLAGTADAAVSGNQIAVEYTPPADFNGEDEFTVKVVDISGEEDIIRILVKVNPVNDLPTISSHSKSGLEDTTVEFSCVDFTDQFIDSDGDKLALLKLVSLPAHGSLSLAGESVRSGQEIDAVELNALSYRSALGYTGMDYFLWTASDGTDWAVRSSRVSLAISPDEDAPTVQEMNPVQIDLAKSSLPQGHMLTLHGNDEDGDVLTWILAKSPVYGTLQASGEAYNLFLDYIPDKGYQGADAFTIHLTDGHTSPVVIEVSVVGEAQNQAPSGFDSTVSGPAGRDLAFQASDF